MWPWQCIPGEMVGLRISEASSKLNFMILKVISAPWLALLALEESPGLQNPLEIRAEGHL